MEIIGHTSEINKTKNALQHYLIAHPFDTLEMDFMLTRDNVLVWSHDYKVNGVYIPKSNYGDLGDVATLEDVLEVLNNEYNLMLDIKWGLNSTKKDVQRLLTCLEILKKYKEAISIGSFNSDLIKKLLEMRKEIEYAYLGIIINLFTNLKFKRIGSLKGLENIEFVSLASELWEYFDSYKYYRETFPEARLYAWTWEFLYRETEARLKGYVDKGADGVLVKEPYALKRIMQRDVK